MLHGTIILTIAPDPNSKETRTPTLLVYWSLFFLSTQVKEPK